MKDLDDLNRYLRAACEADGQRRLAGRAVSVAEGWGEEQGRLRPLPATPFATAEVSTCWVDSSARIRVRTHHYSVPVRLVGRRVEVRLHARYLEVLHAGELVATHERLVLDHYLELLQRKPGAFPRARALQQARAAGRWPAVYDQLFSALMQRFGQTEGTRQVLSVVLLQRDYGAEAVQAAVTRALELGGVEAGAIAMLLRAETRPAEGVAVLTDLGRLASYGQTRPVSLRAYDALRPSQRPEVAHG